MTYSAIAAALGAVVLFLGAVAVAIISWQQLPGVYRLPTEWSLLPLSLTLAIVGILVTRAQPANRIGWLLCWLALFAGLESWALYYGALATLGPGLPGGIWALWLSQWVWAPEFILIPSLLPAIFPTGELLSPRWKPFAVMTVAWTVVAAALTGLLPATVSAPGTPLYPNPLRFPIAVTPQAANLVNTLGVVPIMAFFCLGGLAAVLRWRRAEALERQQLKWFAFAVALVVLAGVPGLIYSAITNDQSLNWLAVVADFALNAVPIAIGFAILRYRLYDIDVVINRALVYGALAILITLVYVAVVVGVGQLLGTSGHPNLVLSILATAIVAVAFQPVRERTQKFANRLLYGHRATPYETLAEFSRQLSGAVSSEEVLPKVAEAAGTALNAQWAQASLLLPEGGDRTADWGRREGNYSQDVEVRHEGELLGHISLVSSEPLGDERILGVLNSFARQAGPLFRNLRLTAELQEKLETISRLTNELDASRSRIVAAADEERRRLEAQISQTTRRQLAEITDGLQRAREMLPRDTAATVHLLEQLAAQANAALDGLRELARGVFPPLLVDRGLVPALQAQLRRAGDVSMEVDPEVANERFDAAVEAALYFTCVEALRGNKEARLSLGSDGELVTCSVVPLGAEASPVVIRDRVEALGGVVNLDGGSRLEVRLPARPAPLPA